MNRIAEAYGLDVRSLALLRILVGLGFVIGRLINLPWVVEFYTDHGSYPRVCAILLPSLFPAFPTGPSIFNVVGSDAGVFFLYFLTIAAGVALTIGYRTRLATLCCWMLGFSLYNRCPVINPASDAEILLCLFFGFFLPWGDLWSVDNPQTAPPQPRSHKSLAALGWRIQICTLYMTAAFSKTSLHWGNGSASMVAMKSDAWSSFIGRWVAGLLTPHPELAREMTNLVVMLEFALPFLLLTPLIRVQLLAILSLILMHVAFGLALHLEAFTPLAIVCLSGFLPSCAWQQLSGLQGLLDKATILWRGGKAAPDIGSAPVGPYSSAFLTWALLGIVWSCALSVRSSPIPVTDKMLEPWHALGLQQSWGMFVPPPFQGGWYVFRGKTVRGDWVNLEMDGGSAESLSLPSEIDETMPSSRHVLLYNTLIVKSEPMASIQERIATDFRLRWEEKHPDPLDRLQELEIYKYYREYDCYQEQMSKIDLKYTYKRNVL